MTPPDDGQKAITGTKAAKFVLRHVGFGAAAAVVIIAVNHAVYSLPLWSTRTLLELGFLLLITVTVTLVRLDRLQRGPPKRRTSDVRDERDDLAMPNDRPVRPTDRQSE